MKVIFMGTPDFSVPALKKLIDSKDYEVVGVFTQKPKAKGRGLALTNSPVHNIAINHHIPVYTPSTLKSDEALRIIDSIEADIIIVVAYGFIIPENILNSKKYGALNIHPSMLPKYRGAAPLQRTIINGESKTAVCIMQMDSGLDTGDIILSQNFELAKRVTLLELHDKCANIGAELLIKVLDQIETLPRIPQNVIGVSYAHKFSKEEAKIIWEEPASLIDCKIRGMSPWPGTYFEYQGKIIKVLKANYKELEHEYNPGLVINEHFEIACGKGILILEKLQLQGKNPQEIKEFSRGFKIVLGSYLK